MTYVLTTRAAAELREITSYTYDRWGEQQSRLYTGRLFTCMEALAAGRGRAMPHLDPGVRMTRCAHHYIFGLVREGNPMLIVALLHERMDIMMRLAGRLES